MWRNLLNVSGFFPQPQTNSAAIGQQQSITFCLHGALDCLEGAGTTAQTSCRSKRIISTLQPIVQLSCPLRPTSSSSIIGHQLFNFYPSVFFLPNGENTSNPAVSPPTSSFVVHLRQGLMCPKLALKYCLVT